MSLLNIEAAPLAVWALGPITFFLGARILYNLYFHPLRHYPGPKLWAATEIPYTFHWLNGSSCIPIAQLHSQYGDVVRVSPSRLSFIHPDAWTDIRGHRKTGAGENPKEPEFFAFSAHNILGANRVNHSRFRRALAHGFSAKTMQAQQPLITEYVDLLLDRLKAKVAVQGNAVVDLSTYFNLTTFDVIGDLAFGTSFNGLRDEELHSWARAILNSTREFYLATAVRRNAPWLLSTIRTLAPNLLGKGMRGQVLYAKQRVDERIETPTERPDYINSMLSGKGDTAKEMTHEQIMQNARILAIAGSETTATALSGTVFFLVTHPDVQRKLAKEIRSTFESEDEIDMHSVQKLKYMLAVLDESLRMMPPVPGSFPRVAQSGGDVICGQYVPEGTGLDIWPIVAFHSPRNFTDPDEFIPERWMEGKNERFVNDKVQAFQPFSLGPRNCIGKNLAYIEMRLILARLVWNFDLDLGDDKTKGWFGRCRPFNLWERPPLNVKLVPVRRDL
ncbi:cytochrome P450 [Podospora aff. communis PSN243]|uniref:Cytochrome P450 n=1 Tax=Podospora aff. communis PSN243 TaxID=3040156 RepID=A0AAV9GIJ8_9PEZI|nr:cytochrome P450 [Podospora aff. communis PSN243]